MDVCVLGLGNVGLAVAKYVSKKYPVMGYDISPEAVKRAIENGISSSTQLLNHDIYSVTVSTWLGNGTPDMSAVEDCCKKISEKNPNALVCLESTLAVGTARKMAEKHGFHLVAVCPHRWWKDDEVNHGVVQPRVMGALNGDSMKRSLEFYNNLGIPITPVSSLEMAELSKIVENSCRYIRISYAEELKMICDAHGFDFNELREACNTKWNCQILEARDGIGRECLPKDIHYLLSLAENNSLLGAAIRTDQKYRSKKQNGR